MAADDVPQEEGDTANRIFADDEEVHNGIWRIRRLTTVIPGQRATSTDKWFCIHEGCTHTHDRGEDYMGMTPQGAEKHQSKYHPDIEWVPRQRGARKRRRSAAEEEIEQERKRERSRQRGQERCNQPEFLIKQQEIHYRSRVQTRVAAEWAAIERMLTPAELFQTYPQGGRQWMAQRVEAMFALRAAGQDLRRRETEARLLMRRGHERVEKAEDVPQAPVHEEGSLDRVHAATDDIPPMGFIDPGHAVAEDRDVHELEATADLTSRLELPDSFLPSHKEDAGAHVDPPSTQLLSTSSDLVVNGTSSHTCMTSVDVDLYIGRVPLQIDAPTLPSISHAFPSLSAPFSLFPRVLSPHPDVRMGPESMSGLTAIRSSMPHVGLSFSTSVSTMADTCPDLHTAPLTSILSHSSGSASLLTLALRPPQCSLDPADTLATAFHETQNQIAADIEFTSLPLCNIHRRDMDRGRDRCRSRHVQGDMHDNMDTMEIDMSMHGIGTTYPLSDLGSMRLSFDGWVFDRVAGHECMLLSQRGYSFVSHVFVSWALERGRRMRASMWMRLDVAFRPQQWFWRVAQQIVIGYRWAAHGYLCHVVQRGVQEMMGVHIMPSCRSQSRLELTSDFLDVAYNAQWGDRHIRAYITFIRHLLFVDEDYTPTL